jgi:NAD(P)-dependent dehydrogenase (short-subunit alcohol dehydrogenase family)
MIKRLEPRPEPRVVAVVGGSSGIGRASALRFAAANDHLVLIARSHEALAVARRDCLAAGARSVLTVPCDVTARGEFASAVERILDEHARLDVVVHTATVMAYGGVEKVPGAVFDQVVDTAVHGTRRVVQAVLPVFRQQQRGTLIVLNSLLGGVAVPDMGAYVAAKWGQRGLVRSVQTELRADRGARRIRVCMVAPGSIDTPIYAQAANYTGRQPRPVWPVASPERVAAVISRLADHPRNHVSVAVGVTNPAILIGFRFLPFVYDRIAMRMFRALALTRRRVPSSTGNVHAPVPAAERVHGR